MSQNFLEIETGSLKFWKESEQSFILTKFWLEPKISQFYLILNESSKKLRQEVQNSRKIQKNHLY